MDRLGRAALRARRPAAGLRECPREQACGNVHPQAPGARRVGEQAGWLGLWGEYAESLWEEAGRTSRTEEEEEEEEELVVVVVIRSLVRLLWRRWSAQQPTINAPS